MQQFCNAAAWAATLLPGQCRKELDWQADGEVV